MKNTEGELPNGKTTLYLGKVNWIGGSVPEAGKKYMARSRYRETLQEITINNENFVTFSKPQFTISPGQSLVIYNGRECLGGGIISA